MLGPASYRSPLPDAFQLLCACDTGTYMNAAIAAIDPVSSALIVLDEFPNYRYIGGEIELLDLSVPQWARLVYDGYNRLRPGTKKIKLWVDQNSQFKTELKHYGLHLMSNLRPLELRVEITREYMQAQHPPLLYFAPHLEVIPYEFENAQWPDDTSSSGRFERLKHHDHGLDCVEHICSRRPRRKLFRPKAPESFLDRYLREHKWDRPSNADPHLGRH